MFNVSAHTREEEQRLGESYVLKSLAPKAKDMETINMPLRKEIHILSRVGAILYNDTTRTHSLMGTNVYHTDNGSKWVVLEFETDKSATQKHPCDRVFLVGKDTREPDSFGFCFGFGFGFFPYTNVKDELGE